MRLKRVFRSNPSGFRALVSLSHTIGSAMIQKSLAREFFGRGSVLGFVLVLVAIVAALMAVFWAVP
jgi:hypothetical protein